MTKQITAVFEQGVLRPEHPVDLPEGEQLHLIVVTRKPGSPNGNAAHALAEIAPAPITIASYIPSPDGFRRKRAHGSRQLFPAIRIIPAPRTGSQQTLKF